VKALAAFAQLSQAAERAAASVARLKKRSKNLPMKLYIFEGVLADYTPGLAVALARSKRQAISILLDQLCGQTPACKTRVAITNWREHRRGHEKDLRSGSCTIKSLDQPYAVAVHGGS
jgi:hypothetical protein